MSFPYMPDDENNTSNPNMSSGISQNIDTRHVPSNHYPTMGPIVDNTRKQNSDLPLIIGVVIGISLLICISSSILFAVLYQTSNLGEAQYDVSTNQYASDNRPESDESQKSQTQSDAEQALAEGIEYFREEDKARVYKAINSATNISQLETNLNSAFSDQYSEHHGGKLGDDYIEFYLTKNSLDFYTVEVDLAGEEQLEATKSAMTVLVNELMRYPLSFYKYLEGDFVVAENVFSNENGSVVQYWAVAEDAIGFPLRTLNASLDYDKYYARQTIHHEIWHRIEDYRVVRYMEQQYFQYDKMIDYEEASQILYAQWDDLNPRGKDSYFVEDTYEQDSVRQDVKGFISGYAASAPHEDRAEMYSYMVTSRVDSTLVERVESDKHVRLKYQKMIQYLNEIGFNIEKDFIH